MRRVIWSRLGPSASSAAASDAIADGERDGEEPEQERHAPASTASIQIHRDPLFRNGTNDHH